MKRVMGSCGGCQEVREMKEAVVVVSEVAMALARFPKSKGKRQNLKVC